jgi:hypothetical protein
MSPAEPHDITVAISSTQITGAIGSLILILVAIIGWMVRSEWRGIRLALDSFSNELREIKEVIRTIPGLEARMQKLETETALLRRRSHNVINFLNVVLDRARKTDWGKDLTFPRDEEM